MEVDVQMLVQFIKIIMKSPLLHILMFAIGLDVMTGVIKAAKMKKLNSKVSGIGMMKHFVVVFMVIFVGVYSIVFDVRPISFLFCGYYIASYGLSLLENYEAIGLPFPKSLKPFFQQMRENADEKIINQIKVEKVNTLEVKTENIKTKEDE